VREVVRARLNPARLENGEASFRRLRPDRDGRCHNDASPAPSGFSETYASARERRYAVPAVNVAAIKASCR
jgi:hypothetical protein